MAPWTAARFLPTQSGPPINSWYGPVDVGMADQSVEGRRGDERVVVGLPGDGRKDARNRGIGGGLHRRDPENDPPRLVREDLAQVDESVLTN